MNIEEFRRDCTKLPNDLLNMVVFMQHNKGSLPRHVVDKIILQFKKDPKKKGGKTKRKKSEDEYWSAGWLVKRQVFDKELMKTDCKKTVW